MVESLQGSQVTFGWIARSSETARSLFLSVLTLTTLSLPAQALQVQVRPDRPQLGDTISVSIQVNNPTQEAPQVVMGEKTYPTFPIGQNRYRAFIPSSPLDRSGRWEFQVQGDGQVRNLALWMGDRSFRTQSIWLPPSSAGLSGTDHEFDRVDAFKALVTPEKFWSGPFLRPNSGPITTEFGVRRYYNGEFARDYYHRGVDYAGPYGSPVVAPAAGRVALVGREADGFQIHGNTVGVDHGQGVTSIFLHLSQIRVREGDFVQAGQVIGTVGSTGASTGPHLHWGLYVHGVSVDPVPWRYDGLQ
ncbi:M23 family metallopeptidase [Desertifilum sp. FACHB-1129]|uniref:M23 family metallopeptidase n=1 Tax=Desertifilum TaxID=1185872 RepID=UPI0009F1E692|nr:MULTISPECIES: M23 family metallopeptidase [Desertifilum]MBD2313308.1 M23 family metallopeptidase [Desertifilum sp. FACHB-1129]MBD2324231.1 M23 family metallopeptidase [Desertifilum sp. FACHB-866]MBD2334245.1 M23 family metallopeptidase [Desertifilum sp. FACHB-868]MDA0211966.1 M23 family metallopeptidase [Cyanobacteria bacterium FC1]